MKSKRFTTLIVIFAITLLAAIASFGFTVALADGEEETASGNASEFFTYGDNVTATVEDDGILFTLTASAELTTATITSKYDFVLDGIAVTATPAEGLTPTVEEGEGQGKLVISLSAAGEGTYNYKITSVTSGGKNLFNIVSGNIEADEAGFTVSKPFADYEELVWGYNYADVDFDICHGFVDVSSLKKEIVIAVGETEDACRSDYENYVAKKDDPDEDVANAAKEKVRVYAANKTVKFLSNNEEGGCTVIFTRYYTEDGKTEGYSEECRKVLKTAPNEAPEYNDLSGFFTNDYSDYLAEIENQCKEGGKYKYIGSSTYFTVPTKISEYIKSKYFANADLTALIYYKVPGSDSFSSISASSSKRFALSKLGTYEYYVLAIDPMGNELEIDDEWEIKMIDEVYGFYKYDKAGDNYVLQVPVFRFEMGNAGPQVTAGSTYQDNGYVGTSYTKVSSFTTKGNDVTTEYSLLYNASTALEDYDGGPGWEIISDKESFDSVKEKFGFTGEGQTFEDLKWDSSALSFTPIKEGSYVVKCMVSDGEAKTATAATKAINVTSTIEKVTVDTTSVWFQNNWRSVLFLGIAVLSLAGIIVLLFVKPKDQSADSEQ